MCGWSVLLFGVDVAFRNLRVVAQDASFRALFGLMVTLSNSEAQMRGRKSNGASFAQPSHRLLLGMHIAHTPPSRF